MRSSQPIYAFDSCAPPPLPAGTSPRFQCRRRIRLGKSPPIRKSPLSADGGGQPVYPTSRGDGRRRDTPSAKESHLPSVFIVIAACEIEQSPAPSVRDTDNPGILPDKLSENQPLASSNMPSIQESEAPVLKASTERLAQALHESCQFGSSHRYGK